MKNHPIIAVMPRCAQGSDKLWLRQRCMEFLSAAGLLPVMVMPPETEEEAMELISVFSGLMLVGGGDIRPLRYGEEDDGSCEGVCDARDWSELLLARAAIDKGVPLLGICRGAQVIATALGGKLRRGTVSHRNCEHSVHFSPYSMLRGYGEGSAVNSYHHQAISDPGDGSVTAMSDDGVAEAIELPGHPFCLGVQWHPEVDRLDPLSQYISRLFADSAGYGKGITLSNKIKALHMSCRRSGL